MSRLDMSELHGRWYDILASVGISKDYLTPDHGPCPMCGGHDRFRWDNKEGRGTWFCSKCGAGDGAQLAMNFLGCDFRALRAKLEELLPKSSVRASKPQKELTPEERSKALNKLWHEGDPIKASGPVGVYLMARLGFIPDTGELREAIYGTYALMLARVRDPLGKPCSLHRTYLTMEGRKIARKLFQGDLPKGCAIRLMKHDDTLGIAEGIETALSCHALDGVPTWAAMNSALMENFLPPMGVSRIIIFGDRDSLYGGQKSAYVLAERLARDKTRKVEVRLPMNDDTDFNDVHQTSIGA